MYYTGFADEAAKDLNGQIRATLELGWNQIESRAIDGINIHDLPEEQFDEVCRKLESAGVSVNAFGSTVANWGKKITEPMDSSLEETKRAIPRMQRLGAKLIRVRSFAQIPDRVPADQMAEERFRRMRILTDMFLEAGIQPVHENCMNYGGMGYTYTLRLLENVPGLKLVFDTGNPVFSAPADIPFKDALKNVDFSVYMGALLDETAVETLWYIPRSHYLEAWGDIRAFDGTVTIMQPMIEPLFQSKSEYELLAALLGEPDATGHDIVKGYWQENAGADDFDKFWRVTLHQGTVDNSEAKEKAVTASVAAVATPYNIITDEMEIAFRPSPSLWDGRYANNGWLQEVPNSVTKLTWDNAALMAPALAERLNLNDGDVIVLNYFDHSVEAPVLILPGHADNAITVHLGYGRKVIGNVGRDVGFNAYAIRMSHKPWQDTGVILTYTGNTYPLARTQDHQLMEGRNLVVSGTLEEYKQNPEFVQEETEYEKISMYPEFSYRGNAWGMTVDLSACIGCNACVVACQAENNIPVVGKVEVMRSREMHWMRIDRYFIGDMDNPDVVYQPVMCQQCEGAPCEVVCPAAATVHSREGLNDMVYNRCIGTRYCENNCPYKVRHFNFFQYVDVNEPTLQLMRNPNVTVRSRGVMEKCTYCVQRINAARITAKKENRPIRDGEVKTACQAACPADAIVFGNIVDEDSRVARLKASPLNYELLGELNVQPRTTYLARLKNPNPKLSEEV